MKWSVFLSCSSGGASREALSLHPDPSYCQPLLGSLPDQLQSWGHFCLKSLFALKRGQGTATKVHSRRSKKTQLTNSALISRFLLVPRAV